AQPVPDLQVIGQPEREIRQHRVEKWRAALDAMRHKAAVELAKEIVRQPVRAIDRLRLLQRAACGLRLARLGGGDAVAPARELLAQHAEPVQIAAPPRHATARPPRPQHAAIAAVAREELVTTLA